MKVFAFHGDFARPSDLRDDMGNPTWVDEYVNWKREDRSRLIARLAAEDAIILVGYSSGGGFIADVLSHELDNIAGAVVYESPVESGHPPGGKFPVLQAWNDLSSKAFSRDAMWSRKAWCAAGRPVFYAWGKGKHTRWVWRPRTLFRAHNWNLHLGERVKRWFVVLQMEGKL